MRKIGYQMEPYSLKFDDILEARRTHSDFFWAAYDGGAPAPSANLTVSGNDSDAARNAVLGSTRLREMIEIIAQEACNTNTEQNVASAHQHDDDVAAASSPVSYQEKIAELYTDAVHILNEMGHQFSSSTIRLMGYMLSKVFKRVYTHVWVERSGIKRLRQLMAHMHTTDGLRSGNCPVILVPTHRSYVDFLLLSFVLFSYNLQVPLIVAGIDFLKMSFVAQMLRQSGAFFIRRSFSDDRLYWAVFAEYVQELLRLDSHPLEFFIEGTRSRSGKPLYPRVGMLHVVAEMWAKGRIYDACFVPVTIDYDRPLEESLHIRELLGNAKPPESTTGLVKAMSILRENFGTVRVSFHRPLMLRDSVNDAVDRSQFNLMPLFKSIGNAVPQSALGDALNQFGLRIVQAQTRQFRVTPFHLLCALILQELSSFSLSSGGGLTAIAGRKSFNFSWLSRRVLCAWKVMEQLEGDEEGGLMWCRQQSEEDDEADAGSHMKTEAATVAMLDDELRRACHIHHNIMALDGGFLTLKLSRTSNSPVNGTVTAVNGDMPVPVMPVKILTEIEHDNNLYMMLAFYRNHLLALEPVTSAALRAIISNAGVREQQQRQPYYELLRDMFSKDFVCTPPHLSPKQQPLLHAQVTVGNFLDDEEAEFKKPVAVDNNNLSQGDTEFLANLVMPFIKTYYIVLASLLQYYCLNKSAAGWSAASVNGTIDVTAGGDNNGTPVSPDFPDQKHELRCSSLKAFTKHLQSLVRQLIFDKHVSNEREMLSLDTISNAVNWLKYRRLLTVQQQRIDPGEGVCVAICCNNLKDLENYVRTLRTLLTSPTYVAYSSKNGLNGKLPVTMMPPSSAGDFGRKIDSLNLGSALMQLVTQDNVAHASATQLSGKL